MRNKGIFGAIAAALLLTLTACGQASSAASIGGESISAKTVQDAVTKILKERTANPSSNQLEIGAELNASMLKFYFYSHIIEKIAASKKIVVTEAEIAAERKSILDQIGGEAKLPAALVNAQVTSDQLKQFIRDQLLTRKLGAAAEAAGVPNANGEAIQALVLEFTKANKVVINPRYGVWDAANASITAPVANTAVNTAPAQTK